MQSQARRALRSASPKESQTNQALSELLLCYSVKGTIEACVPI